MSTFILVLLKSLFSIFLFQTLYGRDKPHLMSSNLLVCDHLRILALSKNTGIRLWEDLTLLQL